MWSPTHVQVTVQRAKGLLTKGKHKTNDCFVTIALGKEKYQTSVKEKAAKDVEWHEECELTIPAQGNTAEIVLTALHRNFLGVDEFLGTISIPLSSFDVYERPKNRWYILGSKPGKENTKDRGELEVKIGFIVKAGSLTDLSRKERHKSSLGQLSNAAQSIGGSLLSIGSLEKHKGLKKLAKSIGNRVKGKSKNKLDTDDIDERAEYGFRTATSQEPGEADPGVISEDEDEFTFDDLSHKSSASSLNMPASTNNKGNGTPASSIPSTTNLTEDANGSAFTTTTNVPSKPPRFNMSSSSTSLSKIDNQEDEWGRKLYGNHTGNIPKRWEGKSNPKIIIDEAKEEKWESPARSPSPSRSLKFKGVTETASSPPSENSYPKNSKDEKPLSSKEKLFKDDKPKDKKEEKSGTRSPKEEKVTKKDKKKDKEMKTKEGVDDNHPSSERIIIGGEDAAKTSNSSKSRLPQEVLLQYEGKSREDLIELVLQLQGEITEKNRRLTDLENYIDELLLRVIESSPRLLQNPYQSQRRLSSPGHQ